MRIFPRISKQHNQEPKDDHIELQYWYNVQQVLKFTDKEPVKLVFLCDFFTHSKKQKPKTQHTPPTWPTTIKKIQCTTWW
jgi:hypothetical protein